MSSSDHECIVALSRLSFLNFPIAFALFSYDRGFQIAVSIAVALAYVAWGVMHHHLHRDLHLSVFIEYLIVASLGLVIVFSLIFRS